MVTATASPKPTDKVAAEADYRGLPADFLISRFDLQPAKAGFTFPIEGAEGHRLWKRDARVDTKTTSRPKNAWQPPLSKSGIKAKDLAYNLSRVSGRHVFVCAGPPDVWTMHYVGLEAVSFLAGEGTPPSDTAVKRLLDAGIKEATIIYDADAAGRRGREKTAHALTRHGITVKILTLPKYPDVKDVNDLWKACDADKSLFYDELEDAEVEEYRGASPGVRASEVEPQRVRWLWRDRIPLRRFTLLAGDPSIGKSMVTTDLVARVTTGDAWPDEDPDSYSPARQGSALILSAEDNASDTLVPRLERHGADLERVHLIDVADYADYILPDGLAPLEARIRELQDEFPRQRVLVIIDPLEVFLELRDNYRSTDVRKALAPLESLADRTRAAIVGILHLNKKSSEANVMYRFMGSTAFVASARVSMVAAFDPSDPTPDDNDRRRVLAVAKNNLGRKPPSLTYRTVDPGKVAWERGYSPYNANDLLRQAENPSDSPKMDEAIDFLRDMLADRPQAVKDIQMEAKEAGIAWRTVERAKEHLKIKSDKTAKGYWEWTLPGGKTAK